jgi:acetylornithine deacetylase/succinyl-diaminopimelate desuccinylase-like protein
MIQIDTDYLLNTLKEMIRINSVIPHEEKLAMYVAEKIRELGLEPEWHEVAPGRPNVYASADLGDSNHFLTLTGHMDTVDVAQNWPTDPFEPVAKEGKLYGLGSMDMKGGLACALTAFKALVEAKEWHGRLGRIGFAATVDEEGYGTGARALLQTEYGKSDALLLGEPFYGVGAGWSLPNGITGKVLYKLCGLVRSPTWISIRRRAALGAYKTARFRTEFGNQGTPRKLNSLAAYGPSNKMKCWARKRRIRSSSKSFMSGHRLIIRP